MDRPPGAADIIARLELQPHPEGGHYRETFRDSRAGSVSSALKNCSRESGGFGAAVPVDRVLTT
jgi:predicted cupin superfamily sugar epimerase